MEIVKLHPPTDSGNSLAVPSLVLNLILVAIDSAIHINHKHNNQPADGGVSGLYTYIYAMD